MQKTLDIIKTIGNNTLNQFKQKLIDYLLDEDFSDKKKVKTEDFDQKFKDAINLINANAPVKEIYRNIKKYHTNS